MGNDDRLVTTTEKTEDLEVAQTLRPSLLTEFIGQKLLKRNVAISIAAAQKREQVLDHILFYGNPGLGKTTLAGILAKEMGVGLRVTSGPALDKTGDLAAILTNLQAGDLLFIDEIQRLNKTLEEVLYPAMEDNLLDVIVGKGLSAQTVRLPVPPFTLVGATTRLSLLSSPLRDRFGSIHHLEYYKNDEIADIIKRSARVLSLEVDPEAVLEIALRSRRTPRIANRLLKRLSDYALVEGDGLITLPLARAALDLLDVDQHGLDKVDRLLLQTIIDKFAGGPVGLGTLAAATGEEEQTIAEVYEPFLIQLGFLMRTPRGRVVLPAATEYLKNKSIIQN